MVVDILLVTQTPLDIPYILQTYLKYEGERILILCVGSDGVYAYLKKLNLLAEIVLVKPVNRSRGIMSYLSDLRMQKRTIAKSGYSPGKIFYSSCYQDFFTSSLLEVNKNQAEIFRVKAVIDNLEQFSSPLTLFDRVGSYLIGMIIQMTLGFRVSVFKISGQYVFSHNPSGVKRVSIDLSSNLWDRFGEDLSATAGYNILLFESNGQDEKYFSNYKEEMMKLVDNLQKIGVVYVKPHPTRGYSKCLDSVNVNILSGDVPASMLNLSNFKLVVGIETAALKEVRHNKVVSIIDSFSFYNGAIKRQFVEYLRKNTEGRISFMTVDEVSKFV